MSGTLLKFVRGKPVPMTAEEVAAHIAVQDAAEAELDLPEPEPIPKALNAVEYMSHVQRAGELSSEQFVSIMRNSEDADIVQLRIMLEMNKEPINRDAPLVQSGLDVLVAKDFLTEDERGNVLTTWPIE